MMLTDCDLDFIGTVIEGTLSTAGGHMRATIADDGMGGRTKTWLDLGTVQCRLNQARLSYQVLQDRLVTITTTTLVLPVDCDVEMNDRFTIDGDIWTVDGVPQPRGASLQVGVALVRP